MARMYKAAGADLLFASAETFTVQHPIKWIQATNGPKLFFLRARSSNPEQLDGQLTVTAAVSFINSKLQNVQHHIRAPPELEQVVSDPIPEKNDGPVKQIVASTFEKHVLSPDKVMRPHAFLIPNELGQPQHSAALSQVYRNFH